jgi:hypothetical protein
VKKIRRNNRRGNLFAADRDPLDSPYGKRIVAHLFKGCEMSFIKSVRRALVVAPFVFSATLASATVAQATTLTDSTVFSTNGAGENWNGWIWNTQGQPADAPNRWNLYYSTSGDPGSPVFINGENDEDAEIAVDLAPGVYDFYIFGEAATTDINPQQHFVLNLYFNGDQSAPGISGLFGPDCATVCAASHPNGLDLFGASGAAEAGTLTFIDGSLSIALTLFQWAVAQDVDQVWPHWANDAPYSFGSGQVDFVGRVQLTVTDTAVVPLPAALPLFLAGLAGLGVARRRRKA